MADTKLSALAALTGANVADGDLFYVDDVSVTTSKSITASEIRIAVGPQLGTQQASTSGTSIDFTGIPAGTKRITVMFVGVSTNGTSALLVQVGDAGGFETTGYLSGAQAGTTLLESTAGFLATHASVAAQTNNGKVVLSLENSSAFTWTSSGNVLLTGNGVAVSGGSKSLSAELTQVRITTVNGTDAFDAGAINVSYN